MVRITSHSLLAAACAVALLLFMGFRIDWVGRIPPASKNLKTGLVPYSSPAGLCSDEIDPALMTLLGRHKAALERLQHNDTFDRGIGFGWGLQFGTVQARILAICYPQETEAFVLRIVEDLGAKESDLQFATKVLGILASQGSKASLAALVRLAQGGNPNVVLIALEGLFSCDIVGRYRTLYPSACKREILEAFDLGPYWVDQQTKQTLQDILKRSLTKYDDDYYSREALERMRILESPQRSSLLEQLIGGVPPGGVWTPGWSEQRQLWALRVIQKNPTPHSLESLRRRLDSYEGLIVLYSSSVAVSPTHPGWPPNGDYDEFLVAYLALGGKLNTAETERLTYYGYLGDPSRRLSELLSHWCR